MGISISPMDPLYYAELFGVNYALIAAAKNAGISIKMAGNDIGTLVVYGPDGTTYGAIKVKTTAISLAKSNNLGPTSKQMMGNQIGIALKVALDAVGGSVGAVYNDKMTPGQKAAFTKAKNKANPYKALDKDLEEDEKEEAVDSTDADWGGGIGKKTTAGVIKLAQASKLHQSVSGTSPGTVYKVVAIFDGLNIAARRKTTQVSFRAEGALLSSHYKKLASVGFKDNLSQGYASAHFEVPNVQMAKNALGAIVGAVGLNLIKQVTDIESVEVS